MLGNLMSAVEARNITKKIRAEKLEKQIKSYARQIEDAASRGEFYVSCDGEQMSPAARKYLEKHAYTYMYRDINSRQRTVLGNQLESGRRPGNAGITKVISFRMGQCLCTVLFFL